MDMTRMIPEHHPLHRLFRGLTETTFMSELGIGDPTLVGYVASTLSTGGDLGAVLRRLSDQFELCAFGLSRVRREWETIEAEGTGPPSPSGPMWA